MRNTLDGNGEVESIQITGSDSVEGNMVRPERFELPTCCSGGNRSIHLSYGRATDVHSLHGRGYGLQCATSHGNRAGDFTQKLESRPDKECGSRGIRAASALPEPAGRGSMKF
jgi:hypothetical protein